MSGNFMPSRTKNTCTTWKDEQDVSTIGHTTVRSGKKVINSRQEMLCDPEVECPSAT